MSIQVIYDSVRNREVTKAIKEIKEIKEINHIRDNVDEQLVSYIVELIRHRGYENTYDAKEIISHLVDKLSLDQFKSIMICSYKKYPKYVIDILNSKYRKNLSQFETQAKKQRKFETQAKKQQKLINEECTETQSLLSSISYHY